MELPTAPRIARLAGPPFAREHLALMGDTERIDFGALDVTRYTPALLAEARSVWQERFRTELRSVQIMTRFLEEVVASGDPIDVYANVAALLNDELRHVGLMLATCRALGADALLPTPAVIAEKPEFLKLPMPARALCTALSMLIVNETLSVGFIRDLHDRCPEPTLRAVLGATLGDESEHDAFGVAYVAQSMRRFPPEMRPQWRAVVAEALAPHERFVEETLAALPAERRTLASWPDTERAPLGLFSKERQALVLERTLGEVLRPRLTTLGLGLQSGVGGRVPGDQRGA